MVGGGGTGSVGSGSLIGPDGVGAGSVGFLIGAGSVGSLIGPGFGAPVGTDDDTYSVSLNIFSGFLGGR